MVDTSNWPNLLVCTIYTTWTSTTGADGCSLAPALTYSGQWRPGADRVKEHFELSSNHGHVNPQSKSYFLLLLSERIRLIRWSWEQVIFKGKVICHLSRLIAELPALCPSTCHLPPPRLSTPTQSPACSSDWKKTQQYLSETTQHNFIPATTHLELIRKWKSKINDFT